MGASPVPIVPAGEDLCLDFANTLAWRGSANPTERLSRFADLLDWLRSAAAMSTEMLREAERWADADPDKAAALFTQAIALREAIYRMFAALAVGDAAVERDIAALNEALAAAPPRTRLVPTEAGYAWAAEPAAIAMPTLLAPVLWSAADLLAQNDRSRVRRCANDACLWLFIDRSKGGTRRWCDMSSCGNRAKSRRHYLRTKSGAGGEPA
jgi:predicted RNA-binding Zn ribbon-like protein